MYLHRNIWFGGLQYLRTNNTLITSIYLCCVDTWKKLYMSTLGCYQCACVRPCRWISRSVVSKKNWWIDTERVSIFGHPRSVSPSPLSTTFWFVIDNVIVPIICEPKQTPNTSRTFDDIGMPTRESLGIVLTFSSIGWRASFLKNPLKSVACWHRVGIL